MKKVLSALSTLLLTACMAVGQQDANFGASIHSAFDDINLFTLVPTITIPVAHKTGAIPFDFTIQSSQTCDATSQQSKNQLWVCSGDFSGYSTGGYVLASYSKATKLDCPNTGFAYIFSNFAIQSSDGNFNHPVIAGPGEYIEANVPGSGGVPTGNCSTQYSFTALVTDNYGITVTISVPTGTLTNGIIGPSAAVLTRGGNFGIGNSNGSWTLKDPFSNTITESSEVQPSSFTDTLGVSTLTNNGGTWRNSTNGTVTYPDSTGTTRTITFNRSATAYSEFIPGTCPGSGQSSSFHPVLSMGFPDTTSMSFTYEAGGQTGTYTGRVASFVTRQGGTISYGYSPPCTTYPNTFTRTTADGTTTYTAAEVINGSNGYQTTTVLDPGQNKTVYSFNQNNFYFGGNTGNAYTSWNNFLTEKDIYQNTGTVGAPTYMLLSRDVYCYNTNLTSCQGAAVVYPITQRDVYHYIGANALLMSHETETYDPFGDILVDTKVDGITGQTLTTTTTYGSYSNGSCTPITGIPGLRCTVTTTSGNTQLAESMFSYNSSGASTSSTTWISNANLLTTTYTPNANGTIASVQEPNGQITNYTYGACNDLLPTASSTTVNSINLTTGATWDCNAAVVLTSTDANSNKSTFTYDSMNRPSSKQDPLGFAVSNAYTNNSVTTSWSMTSPSASSATTVYIDGLGRPINAQTTHGSSYDTLSATYGFNGVNPQTQASEPCSTTTPGSSGCTSLPHKILTDKLGRPQSTSTADNETVNYGYSANDIQMTLTPAPSGENVKSTLTEYDGFGRPSSVCNVMAGMGSTCHQPTGGNHNGIFTTFSYLFGTGSSTVTATRGSQVHTTVYDAAGRVTSETYPESGTTTYIYDSVGSGYCDPSDAAYSSPGNLVATSDGAGNHVCRKYDGLNRITDMNTNHDLNRGGNTYCKRFRYDSTANELTSDPFPSLRTNILGRMVQAETDTCASPTSTATNEFFGYDADGRSTVESSAALHRTGYANVEASYYTNGAIKQINNTSGGLSQCCYTNSLDSNGNPVSVTWPGPNGPTTVVNSITYDSGGRPAAVALSSTIADNYTYDSNTGNMNGFVFNGMAGNNSVQWSGTPTWNQNGTLQKLAIADGFNSGGTQTCNFGYDDVARLTSANCGTLYNDTYFWDQFNNITQSGTNSWNPGYNSSNNQETGATYDGAGNVNYDGINTYTWDAYGRMASVNSGNSSATCGPSSWVGSCYVNDAFGMPLEIDTANVWTQISPGPGGYTQFYNGATISVRQQLPGGGTLYASGTDEQTLAYLHPDWIGNTRLTTAVPAYTAVYDTAYAPFGQLYASFGTSNPNYQSFTGDFQDAFTGLWETPNRQLLTNAGRWRSPDPAHSSWNAYAYTTNPLSQTDPSGLNADEQDECMEGGAPCPQTARQEQQSDDDKFGLVFRGKGPIPDLPLPQPGDLNQLSDGGTIHVADSPGPNPHPVVNLTPGSDTVLAASAFFKFYPKMTPAQLAYNLRQLPAAEAARDALYEAQRYQVDLINNLRAAYEDNKHLMTSAEKIAAHEERIAAHDTLNKMLADSNELDADIQRVRLLEGEGGGSVLGSLFIGLTVQGAPLNPTVMGNGALDPTMRLRQDIMGDPTFMHGVMHHTECILGLGGC